jgi:YHS domain-containing protein
MHVSLIPNAAALLALVLFSVPVAAQADRKVSAYNLASDKLAIQGYDPVSSFDVGGARPMEGKAEFQVDLGGAVYRFANEENLALFEAHPELYEPAHGGWCSYAMSKNKKVGINPKASRVSEGRLLLFSDKEFLEFDGDWVPEEHKLLVKADANWESLSGEAPRTVAPDSYRLVNERNLTDASLALEGYDPVAYFAEGGGKPAKGKKKHAWRYKGVLYRFANERNLAAFRKAPKKYEPQHGGWCSYAMGARSKKVEVDPEVFRMTKGQLHLFYTDWFDDTSADWDEDTQSLKKAADKNWKTLLKKARPNS